MSKAEQKAKDAQWSLIDPPISAEIEHQRSKQRRTLSFDARWRGKVEAPWPGAGKVVFDLKTGFGTSAKSDATDWRLTPEAGRALTGKEDHVFSQPNRTTFGKPILHAKPRNPPDPQTSMWDLMGAPQIQPIAPAVEPAPIPAPSPEAFRAKAHRKLTEATP